MAANEHTGSLHGWRAAWAGIAGRAWRTPRRGVVLLVALVALALLAPLSGARAQLNNSAALTLTKSANPTTFTTAGTLITYTYVVTNSGVPPANDAVLIAVTDSNPAVTVSCPGTTLSQGQSMTCTGTYTTTAANVGSNIVNTAVATGRDSCDGPCGVITSNTATATVTFVPPPPPPPAKGSITIVKRAAGGDRTFSFTSTIPGSPSLTLTTVGGLATATFSNVAAGTYSVTEVSLPLNWNLTALSCSGDTGGAPTTASVAALTASIGLDPGENITCTFTNTFNIGLEIQQTQAVIANFLSHRLQLLADDEPDRDRIVRLLQDALFGDPGPGTGGSVTSPFNFAGNTRDMSSQMAMSTSLSQISAFARVQDAKDGRAQLPFKAPPAVADPNRFDVWAEAHFNGYRANTATVDTRGHFNIAYLGADYLFARSVLVGALVEVDSTAEQLAINNIGAAGTGWMAGPYISARLTPNLFFDARVTWGTSRNTVNPFGVFTDRFSTDRWLARGNLTGNWWFGNFRVTPTASVVYVTEHQQSYIDSLGVLIPAQAMSLGRAGLGPELAYRIIGSDGIIWEPHASIKANWNFVRPTTAIIDGLIVNTATLSAEAQAGLMARWRNGFSLRVVGKYDGIGSNSFRSYGGQVWVNVPLP